MCLVGLHIYYKMIHGPYTIKLTQKLNVELFQSKLIMGTGQVSAHLQRNLEAVSEFVLPECFISCGINTLLRRNLLYLALRASAI